MSERSVCIHLRRKLYLVYLLNVVDWVCTVVLLSTGLFYEANPIARTFIDSISLGFILKCVVPFVLIFLTARCLHILDFRQMKIADMMISFGLTVYIAITVDHIINFIILTLR